MPARTGAFPGRGLVSELSSLDTRPIAALQTEVQRAAPRLTKSRAACRRPTNASAICGDRCTPWTTTSSPTWSARARAVEAAHRFLLLEDAGDMADEAEKEYARRRERQALEVVAGKRHARTRAISRGRSQEPRPAARGQAGLLPALRLRLRRRRGRGRYTAERETLVESELPEYEAQVAHQRGLAEQELVENFIHRLREQIEDARQQLDYLNTTLAQLRFGGERYEFITSPRPTCARSTTW